MHPGIAPVASCRPYEDLAAFAAQIVGRSPARAAPRVTPDSSCPGRPHAAGVLICELIDRTKGPA